MRAELALSGYEQAKLLRAQQNHTELTLFLALDKTPTHVFLLTSSQAEVIEKARREGMTYEIIHLSSSQVAAVTPVL